MRTQMSCPRAKSNSPSASLHRRTAKTSLQLQPVNSPCLCCPGAGIARASAAAAACRAPETIIRACAVLSLPCRDSQGFCCSCSLSNTWADTLGGGNTQWTRANLDCSFFAGDLFLYGVPGSASCMRYDPLWYEVRDRVCPGPRKITSCLPSAIPSRRPGLPQFPRTVLALGDLFLHGVLRICVTQCARDLLWE